MLGLASSPRPSKFHFFPIQLNKLLHYVPFNNPLFSGHLPFSSKLIDFLMLQTKQIGPYKWKIEFGTKKKSGCKEELKTLSKSERKCTADRCY